MEARLFEAIVAPWCEAGGPKIGTGALQLLLRAIHIIVLPFGQEGKGRFGPFAVMTTRLIHRLDTA